MISTSIGKQSEQEQLEKILSRQQYALITGEPGVGKTFFVAKYIKNQDAINGIKMKYFDCSSDKNIYKKYSAIATDLGIKTEHFKQIEELITEVNYCFTKQDEVTLVMDNVSKYDDVKQYIETLPKNVKCIMISCAPDSILNSTIKQGQMITLGPFNNQEAIKYLTRCIGYRLSEKHIQTIINLVGTVPKKLNEALDCCHRHPCFSL